MASAPDSQPFFEQHATKIGMERALLDKFIAGGIRTVSQAAYAATPPGQVLTDDKVTALCTTLGEARPSLAQLTVVKRLLFESQTMSLANLKANIEQQPDSTVRKLPGAERAQRLELQATRLGGLEIKHDLEPAFCVYDAVTTQVEQGSLKYIHPSNVPTRQQELSQAKPAKELTLDASGNGLSIQDKQSKVQAQLGTEMATYRALQRRGLAYDLVGVLSFRVHERWLQKAFAHMSAPAPPGYSRPSLQQVLRADRALWLELAGRQPTLTRSPANAPLTDARCLDRAFEEASHTMDVNFHFMPLQQSSIPLDNGGHAARWRKWGDGKGFQPQKWQRTDKGKNGWKGKGEGGFKGKDAWKGKGENHKGHFGNKGLDNRGGKSNTPMPAIPFAQWAGVALVGGSSPPLAAPDEAALAAERAPTEASIRGTALEVEGGSSIFHSETSILPLAPEVDEPASTETQFEERIGSQSFTKRKWDSFQTSELEQFDQTAAKRPQEPVSECQKTKEDQVAQREVTAGMVAAAAAAGMKRSVGLDHIRIPNRKGKVIQLDLLLESHQNLLWKWLDSPGLEAVWIAPPCGTAGTSPSQDRAALCHCEVRSTLKGSQTWPRKTQKESDFCMFGGQRLKRTALLSNSPLVQSLAAQCDGTHTHAAWGRVEGEFVTKQESAYPALFCKTFIMALTGHLSESGYVDEREVQELKGPGPASAKVLSTQARTKRAASFRVIPEFRKTVRCHVSAETRGRLIAPKWMPACEIDGLDAGSAEEVKVAPVAGSPTDVWVHVPWTPQEFVLQAIDKNASMKPLQIMQVRAAQSQRWLKRASELEEAEATFKQSLPPHIQASLRNKRILLFKEMLEAAHYPDKAVADDMAKGFSLIGHLELPAGWAPDFRPASISASDLASVAADSNEQIIQDVASSSSFTEELWQRSMEEVAKGWSEGPFTFEELPEGAVISKRFAIQQGKKVRPIDDLSQSFLNAAFGSEGKIQLHDTETIAAALLLFLRRRKSGVQGKTIDLKNAYRQLPLSPEALEMSFIAVKHPETGQDLASSSEKSANFLLDLLGFDFDKDGDKAQPFRSVFRALGVEFNLQDEEGKSFQVANTKERTQELVKDLGDMASKQQICPKAWNKIKGRLHFVAGQLSGRVPKRLMRRISDQVSSPAYWKCKDKTQVSNLLRQLQDYVSESRPRTLRAHTSETVYLFTDASQEGVRGQEMGLGSVLMNQEGHILAWFGVLLPLSLAETLMSNKQKVINELESLVVLLSYALCKPLLQERQVMSYIDNEAARVTLLRMSSESQALTLLASACAVLEDQLAMVPWYARVPSRSNIADKPSRLDFTGLRPDARIPDTRVIEQGREIIDSIQKTLGRNPD
ncbi:unnamed protein product [Symbiodinium sp. CCMP2592]|nr:unnamed protein product [Symbiodinium sp. CCMP2592]